MIMLLEYWNTGYKTKMPTKFSVLLRCVRLGFIDFKYILNSSKVVSSSRSSAYVFQLGRDHLPSVFQLGIYEESTFGYRRGTQRVLMEDTKQASSKTMHKVWGHH